MFGQQKSLEGNRAYRRKVASIASHKKSDKLKRSADIQNDIASAQRQAKVANRIKKVTARKLERLAVAESQGVVIKNKKLSLAEQKQITKRAKNIKFAAKVKSLIS